MKDSRVWLDEEGPCAGCGGPTRTAEVIVDVPVHWCDLCWQRLIVRWERGARRRHPDLFAPEESA